MTNPGLEPGESRDLYMQYYLSVPEHTGGYDNADRTFYVYVDGWGDFCVEPGGHNNNVMALPTITNTNPLGESNWNIYRSQNGESTSLLSNVFDYDWMPDSTVRFQDLSVTNGSEYCYSVTQVNSNDESEGSDELCLTYIEGNNPPSAVALISPADQFEIEVTQDNIEEQVAFLWTTAVDQENDLSGIPMEYLITFSSQESDDIIFFQQQETGLFLSYQDLTEIAIDLFGHQDYVSIEWDVFSFDGTVSIPSMSGPRILNMNLENHEQLDENYETWSIFMIDSWGDGWNGASLDLSVNGTVVLNDVTVASGTDAIEYFNVEDGDYIETFWTAGSYDSECSFGIYDATGALVIDSEAAGTFELAFTADFGIANTPPNPVVLINPSDQLEIEVTQDNFEQQVAFIWTAASDIENDSLDIPMEYLITFSSQENDDLIYFQQEQTGLFLTYWDLAEIAIQLVGQQDNISLPLGMSYPMMEQPVSHHQVDLEF